MDHRDIRKETMWTGSVADDSNARWDFSTRSVIINLGRLGRSTGWHVHMKNDTPWRFTIGGLYRCDDCDDNSASEREGNRDGHANVKRSREAISRDGCGDECDVGCCFVCIVCHGGRRVCSRIRHGKMESGLITSSVSLYFFDVEIGRCRLQSISHLVRKVSGRH